MWVNQRTISTIDFIPSAAEDLFQDVLQIMNDWLVRLPRGQERVICVDTLDTNWPPVLVYAHSSGGLWAHPTYRVKILRVWYRSEGAPTYEQSFVRKVEPQVFEDLERPEVEFHSTAGILKDRVDVPAGVLWDRTFLFFTLGLVLANTALLAKVAFAG